MSPRSFNNLTQRLDEVACLMKVFESRRARRAKNIRKEESAILRGGLVLLSSHIEGFFEELVEDAIEAFDLNSKTTSTIPNEIRARQIIKKTSDWKHDDSDRYWLMIQQASKSPLFEDNKIYASGSIDPGLHTNGFSNPGTGEIEKLMKTVGIKDCWKSFLLIEPRVLYKSEIDAIVSRRNQIAHGDMGSSITAIDLKNYASNFNHTAGVFVDLSERHIKSFIPSFSW